MTWRVLTGDCREVLRTLPAESVQCCVTSPPYWGLRDYGTPPLDWGDWTGSLGLEPTPEQYVLHLVETMRAVRRVLRRNGTLWVNIGDCYIGDGGSGRQGKRGQRANRSHTQSELGIRIASKQRIMRPGSSATLKSKDLVGIPWRVVFAFQADGWWLRSDIIWSKTNPMPESVTDRPTKSHEYLFLLSKSETYFYDAKAIAEPSTSKAPSGNGFAGRQGGSKRVGFQTGGLGTKERWDDVGGTRNRRTVWTFPTRPFKGAHFATFPVDLVEPCILAGSRAGDVVLDPFAGAGTVGLVAVHHGRDFFGIDLSAEYVVMAEQRIALAAGAPRAKRLGEIKRGVDVDAGQVSLFGKESNIA
jgi:DNA modification methylase